MASVSIRHSNTTGTTLYFRYKSDIRDSIRTLGKTIRELRQFIRRLENDIHDIFLVRGYLIQNVAKCLVFHLDDVLQ